MLKEKEREIKSVLAARMRGFQASESDSQIIINVIEQLSGVSVENALAILHDASIVISATTQIR